MRYHLNIVTNVGDTSGSFTLGWSNAYFVLELTMVVLLLATLIVAYVKSRFAERTKRTLEEVQKTLDDVAAQEAIFRAVANHANDGLVYQDMEARILWANPAYCRTMGYELDEIVGRKPQEFCFPPELKPSDDDIAAFRFDTNDATFRGLTRFLNIRKDGTRFWHELSVAEVEAPDGDARVILVSRDVTAQVTREEELERAKAELQHAANHDALTGLKNRKAFIPDVDLILSNPDGSARQLGVLYIDLDHFKAINDTNGHAAGDKILIHVASALRDTVGSQGICCRMGGDEFVVAVPGVSDFETMQHLADALLERIRTPIQWGDSTLSCGSSIGIALSNGELVSADLLIRSSDFALYEAKVPGAPSIARYDAHLHARQTEENRLTQEFSDDLDAGRIWFQYQPIFEPLSGKVAKFETLARWTRSSGEAVPPDRFLPIASRLSRMADIDFAAIEATAKLTATLRADGSRIRGAFNTSSESLAHPDFLARLEDATQATGLPPEALIAEVLETTFFGSDTTNSLAAKRITELRARGHRVYLDDFGIGFAGLAHLGQLDISGIKIDRSLVANVNSDQSARIIATSILRMCEELGVRALAEGIETPEQAEFMVAHGCDLLQGFGVARPMDREAFLEFLASGRTMRFDPSARPRSGGGRIPQTGN